MKYRLSVFHASAASPMVALHTVYTPAPPIETSWERVSKVLQIFQTGCGKGAGLHNPIPDALSRTLFYNRG
jgi:hypothetical protein